MKAYTWTAYGAPDVLQLEERDIPQPGDNEILIRNHATSVFAGDCELRRFSVLPAIRIPLRLFLGLRRPKRVRTLGQEFSGTVEAVGKQVTDFHPGDSVFGPTAAFGAYAEYHCLSADLAITQKPDSIDHNSAAVLPVGGMNALYFHQLADIRPGDKVLLVGAGGSIGPISLQLAKREGAEVTVVDSADKLERLRELGADHAVDYQQEPLSQHEGRYDVVFNITLHSSYADGLRLVKPGGRLMLMNLFFWQLVRGWFASRLTSKKVVFAMTEYQREDLNYLANLVSSGEIKVLVDREFPFTELPAAHAYVESGERVGNVAVRFANQSA
ncbi:MAG: NAD(P)-dependent alcohol dehydrogenase [Gammaproteobacteria bacterium]